VQDKFKELSPGTASRLCPPSPLLLPFLPGDMPASWFNFSITDVVFLRSLVFEVWKKNFCSEGTFPTKKILWGVSAEIKKKKNKKTWILISGYL
jgi:hypothetical protein